MRLTNLINFLFEGEDYHGVHRAPGKTNGAPLWDVTKDVYPDDIYTLPVATAARYYGASEAGDIPVMSIIQSYHNKPNRKIKIYRSVPDMKTIEEEIFELEGYLKQMLRRGRAPKGVSMSYDEIYARKEKLKADLERWAGHYGKSRKYVALLDLSNVERTRYRSIARGFGNEFYLADASNSGIKVEKVVTIGTAKRIDKAYEKILPRSYKELEEFYWWAIKQ